MTTKTKIVKSVSLIAVFTLISRVLGLLRDVITASRFGASKELDTFFAASNIPMILFMAIGTAISTTLIPLYNDRLKEGKKEANYFVNNVLNVFILVTAIISLICILFSKPIVSFLNPGFHGEQLLITERLSIILIPTLILNAIIYIFNGVLQSENNFIIPAIISLPLNIITILYLMIYGRKYGVLGLTIITLIATFAQLLPQIPFMFKTAGFKYKFKINLKDRHLRRMSLMIIPVILGTSAQQINSFVERGFATKFAYGSLSALSYSYRVFTLFVDIFVVAISTVVYTIMARHTANNEIDEMKSTLTESLGHLVVFIVPISFIVMLESKSIIFILFERGEFTRSSTLETGQLLLFYTVGLLAYGIRDFICKAFYTLKDTKTPMINSAFAMGLNVILILVLQRFFKLNGLAMANAISTYIASLLLIISLRKKIGSLDLKNFLVTIFKTLLASASMIIVMYTLNKIFSQNLDSITRVFGRLLFNSAAGITVYIIVGYLINIKSVRAIIYNTFKRINLVR